jgi:S-DNA-T family DNA segregation ATPase FtsK/SpoIIIE
MLLPLPVGIAMALLFSPFFLMFSLLSPITAVGRNYDGKRRKRKALARNAETMREDLLAFIDQLDQRRAVAATQRRAARPDLAELAEIARTGHPSLWRVRSTHIDFLHPVIGVGPVAWEPEVIGELASPEMEAAVTNASTLPMSPFAVDLCNGLAVGIIGPAETRRAMAATLVSHLVAEHGPGDVMLAAFLDDHSARFWDHLKWLPHLVDETGSFRIATSPEDAEAVASQLLTEPEKQAFLSSRQDVIETPVPVVLVDADAIVKGGVRPLAARFPRMNGRAVVLADTVEALPSFCTSYCAIDVRSGTVEVVDVGSGRRLPGVIGAFAHRDTMVDLSRSLARFVDPDSPTRAASLPDHALLTEILGVEPSGEKLQASWADPPDGCLSLLGAGEDGPLEVEFIRDGPHALVAGTTGAGKSELLRTMIVSLAARYGPDRVTFVLVDFKGGGAFDVFADLPHNVGVVTDLDEHLSARALRCLQAELKHREHRLRDAGVSNVTDLPDDAEPLPRLLIVVDEFATLAAELPDFMASLIDVAQRGRSLGIHMVLATQRPTGVVDAKIRANTNLRIALRVQDDGDSMDVIGGKAAAEIDRRHPGRAFARFGAGELIGFQTALVSVSTGETVGPTLHLDTFELLTPAAGPEGPSFDVEGPDDLARYVEAACHAQVALGLADPRVPWPDPLPLELSAEDLLTLGDDQREGAPLTRPWSTPFGLIDLPDDQCQTPAWWSPNDGNVVFYGIEPGIAASAVATVVLGLAHRHSADEFHVYVLDFAGSLAALRQLPHAGGYVNADDDERLLRTIQLLETELDRRRRLLEAAQVERLEPTTDLGEPTPLIAVNEGANHHVVAGAYDESQARKTIESGFRRGLREPRVIST